MPRTVCAAERRRRELTLTGSHGIPQGLTAKNIPDCSTYASDGTMSRLRLWPPVQFSRISKQVANGLALVQRRGKSDQITVWVLR